MNRFLIAYISVAIILSALFLSTLEKKSDDTGDFLDRQLCITLAVFWPLTALGFLLYLTVNGLEKFIRKARKS